MAWRNIRACRPARSWMKRRALRLPQPVGSIWSSPASRPEAVVLHAVCDAIAAGYRAYVPVDACGGMSSRTEEAAFRQIAAAGGIKTAVVTLVTALAPDASTDLGGKAFGLIQSIRLA